MTSAIELSDIHLSYSTGRKRIDVFSGGDVVIEESSVAAFVGPSGGGKSSLLNLISGIARPSHGAVIVLGVDLTRLGEDELADFRAHNVGFVFQSFHLIPHLDAASNVSLPLRLRGMSRRAAQQRAIESLEQLGLAARARHRSYQLSGGEQQRVAIARAMITDPQLILADEPTGSLDEDAANVVLELLLSHATRRTIIICTHDQSVAARAGTVWRVGQGRITSSETPVSLVD